MKLTIFYSWQMKTNVDVNKNFIEKCLTKAAKNIENKGSLKRVFFNVIDRDTLGKSGSPHIETTIINKISDCNIFVGDLTIHHLLPRDIRKELKAVLKIDPNAEPAGNVLYEYGRAAECVTEACVIGVSNTAYCTFNEQIFDLNHYRKPIEYNLKSKRFVNSYKKIQNKNRKTFLDNLFLKKNEKKMSKYESYFSNAEKKLIQSLEEPLRMAAESAIQLKEKKYSPFIPHSKQVVSRTIYDVGNFSRLKDIISSSTEPLLRLKGMSGLGKTTLVYKAFENEELKNDYRYYDLNEDPQRATQILTSVSKAVDEKDSIIFIVDNCPLQLYYSLQTIINLKTLNIRIITISNDYTENEKGISYLELKKDDTTEVIDKILFYRKIPEETKKQIQDLAYGNTKFIELLLKSISDTGNCSVSISNSELMDKLLQSEKNTEDRKVLQSFALFKYIGLYPPREDEYQLIANDINFTPLSCPQDVKENVFYNVYNTHKAIFERSGSLVGIRPLPLALFLVEEWFDSCSPARMRNITKLLDSDSRAINLIEPFCLQVRYLNDNQNAIELVTKLVTNHGPFGNAEVLSSKTESRLFRSFAEVAPEAVADNLYRNITTLSFEIIRSETEGRRNIVWTLQSLCFDKRSFEKAAKTLLHIAVAENESYGNNATNEFKHLFSIYLPGTEVSLRERFNLLNWAICDSNYKFLVIQSLRSVFDFEHVVYWGGAEKQGTRVLKHYEPSEEEILEYFSNCFEILKNEILECSEYKDECKNIICNSIRCLCRFGYISFIIPKVIEIIKSGNSDWDELVKSINSVKTYDIKYVKVEERHFLDDCLKLIKKEDFFSRFIRAGEIESYGEIKFEDFKIQQKKQYENLAEEFSKIDKYQKADLEKMYSKECYFSKIFGYKLAALWRDKEEKSKNFITMSIELLLQLTESYPSFFVAFLEKTKKEYYDFCIDLLKHNTFKNALIFKLGSLRNNSFDDYKFIFDFIDKDKHLSKYLFDFSQWHNWEITSDEDIVKFYERLVLIDSLEKQIIYNIAFRIFSFEKISKYPNTFNFIYKYTLQNYETFNSLCRDSFFQFAETIFRDNTDSDFAKLVNEVMLYSLSQSKEFEGNGYYETLFKILMKDYFSDIFGRLSAEFIKKDNPYEHFNLVNIFRTVHGSHDEKEEKIYFMEHKKDYLEWCDGNSYAPVFLAEIIPVYGENDITEEAKIIIEKYYDKPNLLHTISVNMGNLMWTGSVIPILEHKKRIYEVFKNNKKEEIRNWAKSGIENVNEEIEYQKNFEKEQAFINGL